MNSGVSLRLPAGRLPHVSDRDFHPHPGDQRQPTGSSGRGGLLPERGPGGHLLRTEGPRDRPGRAGPHCEKQRPFLPCCGERAGSSGSARPPWEPSCPAVLVLSSACWAALPPGETTAEPPHRASRTPASISRIPADVESCYRQREVWPRGSPEPRRLTCASDSHICLFQSKAISEDGHAVPRGPRLGHVIPPKSPLALSSSLWPLQSCCHSSEVRRVPFSRGHLALVYCNKGLLTFADALRCGSCSTSSLTGRGKTDQQKTHSEGSGPSGP